MARGPAMRPIEVALQQFEYDTNGGCWLWWGRANDRHGYGSITRGRGKRILAHRASYAHHVGPIPDGMEIMHSCDVPACINPAHLKPGTHKENMDDRDRKGRLIGTRTYENGVRNPRAQYTEVQVVEIRERYAAGETLMALAETYGVRFRSIHDVVTGKTYPKESGPITKRGRTPPPHPCGSRHAHAALTEEGVRRIRGAPGYRGLGSVLAKEFGVSRGQISRIRRGNAWTHVR